MNLVELSRYAALLERLARAEDLLVSLQEAAYPKHTLTDGLPRASGTKDRVGTLAAEIADLTERIRYLRSEIEMEEQRITDYIDTVDDERLRVIVRLKFLRNLTWMQTAETMGDSYTEESVKAIAYRGLSPADTS